jgi:hypothetical protein
MKRFESPVFEKGYPSFEAVNRVELIDNKGRAYVKYNVKDVVASWQDGGKTLKIFVTYEEEEEISND